MFAVNIHSSKDQGLALAQIYKGLTQVALIKD